MRKLHIPVLLLFVLACFTASGATFSKSGPTSTDNDDTCDIGLFPAATLLLPYFDVDLTSAQGSGETTIFSVTNVTNEERIAHVTLWTDYSFPVISFNIFLTGYDVQSINLYDVIALGQVAPPSGTGVNPSPEGDFSDENPRLDKSECMDIPPAIATQARRRMQEVLTAGRIGGILPECTTYGGVHGTHAVGYATIDVVRKCTTLDPSQPAYYTDAIAFDNVLMGEIIQVNRGSNLAEGSSMVHIRAIPEGGTAATRTGSPDFIPNAPRSFYGRFTGSSKLDGRQPLPSRFATRWIRGGTGEFDTELSVWREARTGLDATCGTYTQNRDQRATEYAVFDEEENVIGDAYSGGPDSDFPFPHMIVPSTKRLGFDDDGELPFFFGGVDPVAGWVYLDLDEPGAAGDPPRQAWVTASMRAEGRYSVSLDAIAMGNGCSPAFGFSEISSVGTATLAPSPNVNP